MFIQLRRRITECVRLGGRNSHSLRRLRRVVCYLVLYPVIYIALTLPLAIGRMENVTGHPPSVTYFCIAGSLMTLSGLCDTILYTLSRKNSILGLEQKLPTDSGSSRLSSMRRPTLQNVGPSIMDAGPEIYTFTEASSRSDATDETVANGLVECLVMDQRHQNMTIDMTVEPEQPLRAT